MSVTLEGKTAVVTGAGRGVGRAHALYLAALGAQVIVNDVGCEGDGAGATSQPADEVVAEIRAAGGRAVPNFGNVAEEEDADALIAQAIDTYGALDVLVCNAGIVRDKMMYNLTVEDWDLVEQVNLRGHFLPCRAAARHWRERSKTTGKPVEASVVLTSSAAGLFASTGQLNYTASKAAIAAMAIGMARELDRFGVRTNAICPRARTRMTETIPEGATAAPIPDATFDVLAPENNSPMVGYLASDHSQGITGQVFITGKNSIQWLRGWSTQGELKKNTGPFEVAEIHDAAATLFGDLPTRPAPRQR